MWLCLSKTVFAPYKHFYSTFTHSAVEYLSWHLKNFKINGLFKWWIQNHRQTLVDKIIEGPLSPLAPEVWHRRGKEVSPRSSDEFWRYSDSVGGVWAVPENPVLSGRLSPRNQLWGFYGHFCLFNGCPWTQVRFVVIYFYLYIFHLLTSLIIYRYING